MADPDLILVGTLTRGAPYHPDAKGEGLLVFSLNEETAELTLLSKTGGIDNPTYLCLHPEKPVVYAVSEVVGWNEGVVSAYAVDTASGCLHYLGKQPTRGSNSNFVSTDLSGRHVIVANYAHEPWSEECPDIEVPGKAIALFPLDDDGRLLPPSADAIPYRTARHFFSTRPAPPSLRGTKS
jgi:6-phosphogluconolactonase